MKSVMNLVASFMLAMTTGITLGCLPIWYRARRWVGFSIGILIVAVDVVLCVVNFWLWWKARLR